MVMTMVQFTPTNKVQQLAYKKWGVVNAQEFSERVSLQYGTARTIWLYASTNHKADHLKAVADALETTIDKLFYSE
jgi:hypothetical protein